MRDVNSHRTNAALQARRGVRILAIMQCSPFRCAALILLALTMSCSGIDTAKPPVESRDQLKEKIDAVITNGEMTPVPAKTTSFSQTEVNSALTVHFRDKIPGAISEPQIRLLGNSRLTARVVVDVDEFRRKRGKSGNAGPLNFFGGKIPVLVRGDLITRGGQGQFKLQSAEVNGIPLPKSLVQEMLATYTRSRSNPNGIDLEKPFDLPVNIREVIVNLGEAVVVQ
jgi:hypothetical protein